MKSVDSLAVKLRKCIVIVLYGSLAVGLVRWVGIFSGNIGNNLVIPTVLIISTLVTVVTAVKIKESLPGKIMYGLVTGVLALPIVTLAFLLAFPIG